VGRVTLRCVALRLIEYALASREPDHVIDEIYFSIIAKTIPGDAFVIVAEIVCGASIAQLNPCGHLKAMMAPAIMDIADNNKPASCTP
jgi:hypothetical protein